MPIYEFRCERCGAVVSHLVARPGTATPATSCRSCGAGALTRILSRFAVLHSEEGRLERLADETHLAHLEERPAALGRWLTDLGASVGVDAREDARRVAATAAGGDLVAGAGA